MLRNQLTLFVGFSVLVTGIAFAQPRRSARGGPGGRGPGGRLPEVGSTVPDITLYNDAGEEFSTNSLRGQYSVLVFGCLT